MSETTIVSFEANEVKVITTVKRRGRLRIKDFLTIDEDRFNDYLVDDPVKSYLVVKDFAHTFQDEIRLPRVPKKYVNDLIQKEVKRIHPEISDASTIVFRIGEKAEGTKVMVEYLVYVIQKDEIEHILKRFLDRGKDVKAVYPDVFIPISLFPVINEPYLCTFGSGENKIMILVKAGNVVFMRSSQALEYATSDYDYQNISMTLNHCRQTLRINPIYTVLLGTMSVDIVAESLPPFPMVSAAIPDFLSIDDKVFTDYLLPVSAASYYKSRTHLPQMDVSPHDYNTYSMLRMYLKCCTSLFIVLSIIFSASSAYSVFKTFTINKQMVEVRQANSNIVDIYEEYKQVEQPFKAKAAVLTALKAHIKDSKPSDILRELSRLSTSGLTVTNLTWEPKNAKDAKEALIAISGTIDGDSLYEIENRLEMFKAQVKNINGAKEVKSTLNIQNKSFQLSFNYQKSLEDNKPQSNRSKGGKT